MSRAASPENVIIESIVLSSDRLTKPITITPIVDSMNIYENITMPYLTGNMLIFDDNAIYSQFNIVGTERIEFTFKPAVAVDGLQEPTTKKFIITSVEPYKSNDGVAVLNCDIIEEHGYIDNLLKISKSYIGFGEQIISDICNDKLRKNVRQRFESEATTVAAHQSYQKEMRYIVPYISPLDACKVVTNRLTTAEALPFFLFSTLHSDDLILTDLGSIIRRDPFNKNRPFIFSQAETNKIGRSLETEMFVLNSYQAGENEDTLMIANQGAISTQLYEVELSYGGAAEAQVSVVNAIDRLKAAGFIDPEHTEPLVDRKFKPNVELGLNSLQACLSNVTVLPAASPYDDYPSISQSQSTDEAVRRVERSGMLALLLKNTFTISGPGMVYTVKDPRRSVGNQIELTVLEHKMHGAVIRNEPDNKTSGNFIILAKTYHFDIGDQVCRYTLECARLTNKKAGVK